MDEQKLIRVLIALAEGDETAADHLTEQEQRAMREWFPSVEAVRAFIQGVRDRAAGRDDG